MPEDLLELLNIPMPEKLIDMYNNFKKDWEKEFICEIPEDSVLLWILLKSIFLYLKNHNENVNEVCIKEYINLLMYGAFYKDTNIHAANVVSDFYKTEIGIDRNAEKHSQYKNAMLLYDSYRLHAINLNYKPKNGIILLGSIAIEKQFYPICVEIMESIID